MDKNDIDDLLDTWYKTKLQISLLEKKCDKYKKYCEKIMNNNEQNNISSTDYVLKRSQITRATVSKKDLPKDIWSKYSKESTFPIYYLIQKK